MLSDPSLLSFVIVLAISPIYHSQCRVKIFHYVRVFILLMCVTPLSFLTDGAASGGSGSGYESYDSEGEIPNRFAKNNIPQYGCLGI